MSVPLTRVSSLIYYTLLNKSLRAAFTGIYINKRLSTTKKTVFVLSSKSVLDVCLLNYALTVNGLETPLTVGNQDSAVGIGYNQTNR